VNKPLYDHALRLLARRAHSREELRRKLARRASSEEVEEVLTVLERRRYLDDREFAVLRARSRRTLKRWGNRRIALDLRRLGVDARMVEFALRQVDEELPEVESLKRVIEIWTAGSGVPERVQDLKRLYDHCLRLGYPERLVRSELSGYFLDVEWN